MRKPINIFVISMIVMMFSCPSLMGQAGGGSKTKMEESPIFKLLSETGKIIPDAETNSFLVIDYPANIAMVKDYLKMADIPDKQILIEARVVEVKLAKEHSMGVNWSLLSSKVFQLGSGLKSYGGILYQLSSGEYTANPEGQNLAIDSNGNYITIHQGPRQMIPFRNPIWKPLTSGGVEQNPFTLGLFNNNIDVVLKCLTTQLDTNVLSAPKITTTNNRRARIDVTKTVPYVEKVESEVDSDTNVTTYTYTYTYADEGVNLSVTPLINSDGSITMDIHPEVKEIVAWHNMPTVPGAATPPQLPETDVRVASTKVTVRPGQTIVIGGLIRNKVTHGVTKVPLLGDLPFLKNLFRSKIDTTDKTELLIFVSPTIINSKVLMDMDEQRSLGIAKLSRKNQEKEERKIFYQRLDRLAKEVKELAKKRRSLQEEIIEEKKKSLSFKPAAAEFNP